MAAATITSSPSVVPLLLLLLLLRTTSTSALHRDLLLYAGRKRAADVKADPLCREMGTKKECLGRSGSCRWCRSDALDDACFGLSEAWRLPPQVFSCE